MLKRQLLEIGLSEYANKCLPFFSKNGHSTAQKLYTGTGINRVTTYNILEGLIKKDWYLLLILIRKSLLRNPQLIHDFLEKQKHLRDEEHKR